MQFHEERVSHIIKEVLVLWAALLVAVDEALDKPEDTKSEVSTRYFQSKRHTAAVRPVPAYSVGGLSSALGPPPGQDPPPPRLNGNGWKVQKYIITAQQLLTV